MSFFVSIAGLSSAASPTPSASSASDLFGGLIGISDSEWFIIIGLSGAIIFVSACVVARACKRDRVHRVSRTQTTNSEHISIHASKDQLIKAGKEHRHSRSSRAVSAMSGSRISAQLENSNFSPKVTSSTTESDDQKTITIGRMQKLKVTTKTTVVNQPQSMQVYGTAAPSMSPIVTNPIIKIDQTNLPAPPISPNTQYIASIQQMSGVYVQPTVGSNTSERTIQYNIPTDVRRMMGSQKNLHSSFGTDDNSGSRGPTRNDITQTVTQNETESDDGIIAIPGYLQIAQEQYQVYEKVMDGGQAEVYLGQLKGWRGSDEYVAIKILDQERTSEQAFLQEVGLMASLERSGYTVLLLGFQMYPRYTIIMPWFPLGSLHDLIYRKNPEFIVSNEGWNPEFVLTIGLDIANAVCEFEKRKIVHRDIKVCVALC